MKMTSDYLAYLVKTYGFSSLTEEEAKIESTIAEMQGQTEKEASAHSSADIQEQSQANDAAMVFLDVAPQNIFETVKTLKEKEGLWYLHNISGVHLAAKLPSSLEEATSADEQEQWQHQGFEVVYHLSSLFGQAAKAVAGEVIPTAAAAEGKFAALKVLLPAQDHPALPSIDQLFISANWFEREIYDLFGIVFENSRDLSRIMLPPDWRGHPLRKDYREESSYNGMPTTRPSELAQKRVVDIN